MDLTPESKVIGKENFRAAIGSSLVRRSFVNGGIQKGIHSGNGLGAYYYGYDEKIDKRLRIGVIGTGDEGGVLIGSLNPEFVEVAAIADIRPCNVWRAFHGDHYTPESHAVRCGLMAKFGWNEEEAHENVKTYGPYQELLENAEADEIEAVIIALPLHLHASAAIAAMKAGLHVLTEKLMAHSVRECKEMARVARLTGKHLATGHQRHYNVLYDHAAHVIKSGLLGDIHCIRTQWHRPNLRESDDWQPPMPKEFNPNDAQANVLAQELKDWRKELESTAKKFANEKKPERKAALGKEKALWAIKIEQKTAQLDDKRIADQVQAFGYQGQELKDGNGEILYTCPPGEELIRWRLWNRTGGGLMAEFDVASLFISAMHGGERQRPLNVFATGSRVVFDPDREVNDHVYCMFEYATPEYDANDDLKKRKKITVTCAAMNGSGHGGDSETLLGTKGTLVLQGEQEAMLFKTHHVSDKTVVKGSLGSPSLEILDESDKPAVQEQEVSAAIGFHATAGAVSRGYTEEIEHWVYCIRKNPEVKADGPVPHCHPEVALADAVIALTTNRAIRGEGRIVFEEAWFQIESDATPEGVKPDVSRYA